MRLVVTRRHHVRVSYRIPTILCRNWLLLRVKVKHYHGLNITNQDRPIDTYRKVMNWRNSLGFPIEIPISEGSILIYIYYTTILYWIYIDNCRCLLNQLFIFVLKEAKDLIKRLICDKEDRIGKESINQIKQHSFFRNVDWNTIRYESL